jgi:hypothetical protein
MDRMTSSAPKARPEYLRLCPDWKKETTLGELDPDQGIEISFGGARAPIYTTPRELMSMGRMPWFLTLDQVEFAFTPSTGETRGEVVPMWRQRVPNGRR